MSDSLPEILACDLAAIEARHTPRSQPLDYYEAHSMLRLSLNTLFDRNMHLARTWEINSNSSTHLLRTAVDSWYQRGVGTVFANEDVCLWKIFTPAHDSIYELEIPDCHDWPQSLLVALSQKTYAVTPRACVEMAEYEVPDAEPNAISKLTAFIIRMSHVKDPRDDRWRILQALPERPKQRPFPRTVKPSSKYL